MIKNLSDVETFLSQLTDKKQKPMRNQDIQKVIKINSCVLIYISFSLAYKGNTRQAPKFASRHTNKHLLMVRNIELFFVSRTDFFSLFRLSNHGVKLYKIDILGQLSNWYIIVRDLLALRFI